MKRVLSLFLILSTLQFSCTAKRLISSINFDCAGSGFIETTVEKINDKYAFGLRYEGDSLGNYQFFLILRLVEEYHHISKNRVALIRLNEKEKKSIIEIKAVEHLEGTINKKTWQYSTLNLRTLFNPDPNQAIREYMLMDDDDKYEEVPISFTYYTISKEHIETIINGKLDKMRFDTDDTLLEIDIVKLSKILKPYYAAINRCLKKNIYTGF